MARVFRPLKFLTKLESLQVLLATIIKSLALLFHVFIFTCFVVSMYAIVGMSLLKGRFHGTCFWNTTKEIWKKDYLCNNNTLGQQCPENTTCRRDWIGPYGGAISFDNFIMGCITVFVCISCEGWTDIMYKTFQVVDYDGSWYWIYYYTLEIIGILFIMNLVRAVLCGGFSKERVRISNRNAFLARKTESKAEQLSVKYVNWIDKAEKAMKAEKKLKDKQSNIRHPYLAKYLAFNSRIRSNLKRIILSSFVYWLMMCLTFLNALILVVQHYNQPNWLTDIKDVAQLVFMVFFLLEAILKLYAVGPHLYFAKLPDKFEFVVMTLWLLDVILLKYARFNYAFFVLHQLQLFRLFQYTKIWGSLKKLKTSILASISSVLCLILLLCIVAFIFAVLGMNIFGAKFYKINPKPDICFDDFFNSLMAVFQIMAGDGWNLVMYDAIKAYGGAENPLALALSLYFIVLNIIGKYILINIFLAIAVDNISLAENLSNEIAFAKRKALKLLAYREKFTQKQNQSSTADHHNDKPAGSLSHDQNNVLNDSKVISKQDIEKFMKVKRLFKIIDKKNVVNDNKVISKPDLEKCMEVKRLFICSPNNPLRKIFKRLQKIFKRLRKIAHKIVNAQAFTNLTLIIIVLSSAMLALEDATDPNAQINKVLVYFDVVFTIYFTSEVLLKVINFGFCFHKGAYCREIWNCFDLFILLTSIVSVILSLSDIKSSLKSLLNILRLLRAFRCLRSVNNIPKLKLIINCIGSSMKKATGIMAVILQCIFIFAVMGVQLFQGKYNFCTDESKVKKDDCRGFFISFDENNDSLLVVIEREWKTYVFNFNHIGAAIISLISSFSGKGWPYLMKIGVDSKGVDEGPLMNNKIWLSLYFIAFLVTMSFFFINLFIGMIVYTFKKHSGEIEGELDRNSINCLDFVMKSKPRSRFMPTDVKSLQYKAWELIESQFWEYFIVFMVLLNTAVLVAEYDQQSRQYEKILNYISYGVLFVFVLEAGIKIYSLRQNYFKEFWNLFDLLIVILGIIGFIIDEDDRIKNSFDASIFSLFRALRCIKLLQRVRPMRILIWVFLKSLQALPYLGSLILIVFYIYAVIGMQLFGLIFISQDEEEDTLIDRHNNFQTFFSSLQVLFRMASGDDWPGIMLDCTKNARCNNELKVVKDAKMTSCGSDAAYLYFISFILLCYYLMLNLILAVIMDNFSFLTDDASKLGPQHLDEVVMVWSKFDPRATGSLMHTEVLQLLKEMKPPVGLGRHCIKFVAYKRLVQMNMILYEDGSVDFTGFFFALVRTALNIYTKNDNLQKNNEAIRNMLQIIWPKIRKRTLDLVIPRPPPNAKHMTIGKIYTAKLIVYNYRSIFQSKV